MHNTALNRKLIEHNCIGINLVTQNVSSQCRLIRIPIIILELENYVVCVVFLKATHFDFYTELFVFYQIHTIYLPYDRIASLLSFKIKWKHEHVTVICWCWNKENICAHIFVNNHNWYPSENIRSKIDTHELYFTNDA